MQSSTSGAHGSKPGFLKINPSTPKANKQSFIVFVRLCCIMLTTLMGTFVFNEAKAQYSNVPVTGFNCDAVLNGAGTALNSVTGGAGSITTVDYPGSGYFFTASDWTYSATGCTALTNFMPATNTVTANATVVGGALTYNLQSYSGLNDLRIPATGGIATGSGTLNVTTPVAMSNLYILCTSGGAAITNGINVTVTFTDLSTQTFTNQTILDWFAATTPAASNLGRIQQTVTGCSTTSSGGPYLYDMTLALSPSNYSKPVQSITFNKTNPTGIMNVFAVGMKAPCAAPADGASALVQGATTGTGIAASFTAAPGAPAGYLVVGYVSGSTPTAPVNGTTYTAGQLLGSGKVIQASNATAIAASGLTGGTAYDVYVYSYNSAATCGGPAYNTANVLTGTMSTTACTGVAGGTYSVGPTGNYASLTAAFTAMNAGITGPVILELQSTYVSTVETFPLTFPVNTCVGPVKSITIRPQTGAAGLSITSANTTGTINFNGANYITIDGRPGGTGTTSQLTISNTNAGTSYAIQFIADGSNNTIKYCTITSRNTSATSGTIVFLTGTTTGNDNNTFDNCSILDGASTPLNAIYSAGTSTSVDNSGNTISNSNIANYFGAATAANGIYLASNSSAWTITGNRFYQTTSRTPTTGTQNRAIQIVTASGGSYTISNNIIGYANNTGTGTTTYAGAFANRFVGIEITSSTGLVSSIQGNTITNISVNTSSAGLATGPVFGGIVILGGTHNIGTVSGNTVGASTGTGAIAVTGTTTAFYVHGIYAASTGTVNIANNNVGSINATGTTTIGCLFYGIWGLGTAGNFTVTNNTIGSAATANSIVIGTDLNTTATSTNQNFYGIRCDNTGNTIVGGGAGLGNNIQNIAFRTSGSGAFYGYYNGGVSASPTYSYNNLSAIAHGWTTTASSGTFYGFYNASTITSLLTHSNNTIQNITNLNTTGTVACVYNSSSTVNANAQNNTFNNISRASTATSGSFYGYYNGSSPTGIYNISGNTITNITSGLTGGSTAFYGIYNLSSASSSWNIFNNTISTITAGSGASYCIYDGYGTSSPAYNNTINNITTGGTIYGLYIGGSITNATSFYSNNIYTLSSNGAASTIYGIYVGATTPNVYKNKVYDITASGATASVYGIYTGGGTTLTLYNNLVGDLKTPTSGLGFPTPSVAGLYISSGTTINAYYNTFHLNATSTGTNFGTTAVYATTTPTTINLRNNIFSNGSAATGTGKTIAYERSGTVLTNYATTSNNNLFYGGTPGVNNLIYADGTNSDQSIGTFKSRMATRDQASVAENPPYLSVSGAGANFLHINTATSTQIESGAAPIATFTDDYDGDTRNASTPDIGADEFTGTAAVVVVINNISITPTGNACTPASRNVTANITAGGSTVTSVTLNYSYNGVAQTSIVMTGGNPNTGQTSTWSGTIPIAGSGVAVTWNVSATDAITTQSATGTSYTDDPLNGYTATAAVSGASVCSGAATNLSAILTKPGTLTLGAGGTTGSSYDALFYHLYGGLKTQFLVKASELTALGLLPGNISALGINMSAVTSFAYGGFAINIAPTSLTNLTSTLVSTGFTQVYANASYTVTTGINSFAFGTGAGSVATFNWDGNSNIIIQFCWSNNTSGGTSNYAKLDATSFTSCAYFRADTQTPAVLCPQTTGSGTSTNRPQFIFTGSTAGTITSVSWSDGTSTVGTGNPLTVNPTVNTTYTGTVTAFGCTKITSNTVTVTTIALPAQPVANNSTQCGIGVPTASVGSGFSSGVTTGFRWYNAQTGGTLIQTGGATYTTSISSTQVFWVSETNGTCESARTQVTATVNQSDQVQASVNNNAPCLNSSISLSAAKTTFTNNNTYSYSWTVTPLSGSGLSGATSGNPLPVTPTASGTYTYTVTATDATQGCVTTSTVIVSVKALPNINSITATPSTACGGTNVALAATSGNQSSGTVAIGTGASTQAGYVTTGTEGFGNPYNYWYGNQRTQYIYTQAELNAAGITAGNITALSYETTALGATPYTMTGFTISLGSTAQTSATSTIITTGLNTVYTNANQAITLGINNYVFSTPFTWDGVSSLVVNICWGNATGGSNANVATVKSDVVSFVSTRVVYSDNTVTGGICAATTGSRNDLVSTRPRTGFTAITGVNTTASMTWVWNPGSLAGASVTANPATTTIYTVTATDPATTCQKTATVTVTINPLPAAPNANNSTQCGTGVPAAFVVSGYNSGVVTGFRWYTAQTGGTLIQTGGATYTGSITSTQVFWVSETNGTCESQRSQLTASVNLPDLVQASVNNNSVCLNSTISLSAAKTTFVNNNTYTYSWTATPLTGSGLSGATSGNPITVTPTATGTYTYTVTATDATQGCVTTSTVTATVKSLPVIASATATPSTVCAGATVSLVASTNITAPGFVTLGTGTSTYATSAFPAVPYAQYDEGGNNEILVKASELTALGLTAGNLTSLKFNVSSLNGSGVHKGYTIKIKHTVLTTLTAFDLGSMTTVFGPVDYQPVAGINTHTFTSPFNWDGNSNILIDICFDNEPTATSGTNYTNNALNYYTATSGFNGIVYYNADGVGAVRDMCGAPAGVTAGTSRPNMIFGGQTTATGPGTLNWTWNPGALPGATVSANPSISTVYTVTATEASTTCSQTATVTVTVNQIPSVPSGNNGTDQCGTALTDANVSSNSGASSPVFKWYSAPAGGTLLQTSTSTTYLTAIAVSTDFYVSEISSFGCEGPRVHISTVVSDADPIVVHATPAAVCLGGSTNIFAAYTPDFNSYAVYTLTATGGAASGITGSVSLNSNANADGSESYSVTPTATGTYTYTIGSYDPDKNCSSQNTVVVTVTALPTIQSFTATPSTVCAGTNVNLVAVGAPHYTNVAVTGYNTDVVANGVGAASASTTGTFDNTQYTLATSDWNFSGSCPAISFYVPTPGTVNGNSTVAPGVVYTLQPYTANNDLRIPATGSVTTGTGTLTVSNPVSMKNIYLLYGAGNGPITSGITVTVTFTDASTQVFSNLTALDWFATTTPAISNLGRVDRTATPACATTVTGGPQLFDMVLALNAGNYSKLVQYIKIDKTITTGIMNVMGVAMEAPAYQAQAFSWTINPGGFTDSTHTVAPITTTTYTATVTNPANGCVGSATTTVTVNPLPAAPSSSDVSRCGPGSVTLTAIGGTGVLHWYNVATGGTSLQTGATYTTNLTANTSFWVAETSGAGCEGTRKQVNVSLTTAPALVITAGGTTTFCQGSNVTLNGATGSSNTYTNFNWSASPSTGAGLSSATGAAITVTPTVGGTYTITLTADDGQANGCANLATIVITLNPNPVITSFTASPSTVCSGGASTLTASSIPATTGTVTLGTGTGTTSTTGITPFSALYEGSREQYLVQASELTALGLTTGNLTSLAFNVTSAGSYTQTGFSIKIANTANTVLSGYGTPAGSFYTVYGPVALTTPAVGLKTFSFTTPFAWDGVSNLLIDICHDNDINASCSLCYGGNSTIAYTATSYNSCYGSYADNVQSCGNTQTAITTFTNRPNMVFGGQLGSNLTGNYNWVFNPGNIAGGTTGTATVNPAITTNYTAKATNATTGCFTVSTAVTVNVTPVGANATATPSTPVCAGTAVTLNGGATGGAPFTYAWTSTPAGSYAATAGITVNPTVTTVYTVTVTDACSGSTTSTVTVTVNPLPSAGIQEGPGPLNVCSPSTQVLHATTDAGSASYQWTLNGSNISAATSSTYTVSAVGSGTYRVIVTNTATNCISAVSTAVVVTVNQQPSAVTVTPATATICNGGSVNLAATGGTIGSTNSTALAENFDNNAPGWTITSGASSPTVSNWYYQSVPYTDAAGSATFSNFTTVQGGKFAYSNADAGGSGSVTRSIITSPVFSLAGYSAATLTFEHAYQYWSSGDTTVALEISTDGGANWSTLQSYYGTSVGTTTSNAQATANASISLGSYLGQPNLRIRYNYLSKWGYYWIIDNVKVAGNNLVNTTFSWLPATELNTATGANVIASPAVTRTYTATATSAAGCTNSNTAVITVNPRPTGIISGTVSYCNGQPTTTNLSIALTGTGPWSGTLSNGASFSGSSSPVSVSVTPSSTTTYTIATLTDANCTAIAADLSGSATITINPRPAGVISGGATYCNGVNTATVLSIAVTGAGPWSGTLSNGASFSGSTSPVSVTVTPSSTTTYTIATLSSSQCSAIAADLSGSVTVTVNPRPTAVISGGATYCTGANTATVLSIAVTGAGPWSGILSNGASFSGSSSPVSVTVTPSSTTTYTVATLTGSQCSAIAADLSGSATVTVNTRPTAVISGGATYCNGANTATALSIAVTGAGPWSGTLSNGASFSGSSSPISVTVTPSSTTTYTVATLTSSQCSSIAADLSGSATITINLRPTGVISGGATYCNGANTATVLSIAVTGAGPWSGTLSNGASFSGSTSPISVTVTPSSTTTYTIATLNSSQCSAIAADLSGSATVTVNPRPTAVISGGATYCNGANTATVLSIAVTGAGPWSGTLSNSAAFSGSTSPISVTVTPSATTTYTVATLTGSQCSAIAADLGGSATITINPRPTAVISGAATYCAGSVAPTTLSIAVTGAGPWTGTLSNGASFSGSTSPITVPVTPSSTTTYTIATLNGSQCSSIAADLSGSATVTVNPLPAIPTISPAGPITQCGSTVTLTASMPGQWQWNLDGSPVSGATSQTYVATASGNYSVTVTNEFGCSVTSAVTSVTINPVPATPIITAGGPTTFCAGGSVTLTSSSAANNQWNLNGSMIGGATNQTLLVTAPGNYTVTVSNGFGCTATSAIITVTVNPLAANPTATVTQPTCSLATGTINITAPLGAGNSYSIGGAFQSNPSFPGVNPGTYTVYVQNSFGCFAPATTNVTVNPQPFTPAAPVITGIVNICPYVGVSGTAGQITYHATATGNGTTTFNWVIPPTLVTIISGQGTADLTVSFQNGFANQPNKQLRVTATNQCGTSPMTIYYLLAQVPNTPGPITGPTDACPLLTGTPTATYTINKAAGAASYLWTLPGGTSATHPNGAGINDTTIIVTFSNAFATNAITVAAVNSCNTSSVRSITVTRTAPSQPNIISGPTNVCPYITPNAPATYTVTAVAGVTYQWSANNGAVLSSAQGSNTVTVSYPAGYTGGTISVTANSGCGISPVRTLTITTLNPATPSIPDVIQTHLCGETGGRKYTYTLSSMPANATSLLWTVPAGATYINLSQISIEVSYPAATVNGVITVQAANPCANSVIRSVNVKLPACSPGFAAANAGTNGSAESKGGVTTTTVSAARTNTATEAMEVKIFPNPTVSDFKLEVLTAGKEEITVRVLDDLGRLYKNFRLMPYQTIALGAELKAGSYLVEVRQGRTVKTSKVIKF